MGWAERLRKPFELDDFFSEGRNRLVENHGLKVLLARSRPSKS